MPDIDPGKDYYTILGISTEASAEEIKHAYRERARLYHPDSSHGDAPRFRQVQEAYEILSDFALKRAYDRQRENRGLSKNAPIAFELYQSRSYLPPMDVDQLLYVLVDIHPRGELKNSQQRLNLALVIDCSTSMKGTRMQNVKMAATDLVESLNPDDRLAIVTFSDRAETVVPSELAGNTKAFRSAIVAMAPGGGTEIYQGLLAGLNQVRRYAADDTINHVILLTDGRTYGDEDQALKAARESGRQGIGISAFGIGEDWHDRFLDNLARAGGGIAEYIHSPSEVRDVLKEQIQGLSNIVARRMRLKVNAASYVKLHGAYRYAPYMEALEPNGMGIALGNLSGDDPTTLVLEFAVHQVETGERRVVRLDLEAEQVSVDANIHLRQDIKATFTLDSVEPEIPPRLLNALARLSAFQLQEKAWQALEQGDAQQATHFLESAATRLFDLGCHQLGQAAMLEVGRLSQGGAATERGRKTLRYGTRSLSHGNDGR